MMEREGARSPSQRLSYMSTSSGESLLSGTSIQTSMAVSRAALYNVVVLGIAFMFIFAALDTTQALYMHMLRDHGHGDMGLYSTAVMYGTTAFAVFLAPLVIPKVGEKAAMIFGGASNVLFVAAMVSLHPIFVYIASVLLGLGGCSIWVGLGAFLTKVSADRERGRNIGLFWALYQMSSIFGGMGGYLAQDDDATRQMLFIFFSIAAGCGCLILFLVRSPEKTKNSLFLEPEEEESKLAFKNIWKTLGKVFVSRDMLLMILVMVFSGYEISFFSGEFPRIVESPSVAPIMITFGAAEVAGGLLTAASSDKAGNKSLMMMAMVIYLCGLGLSWVVSRSFDTGIAYVRYHTAPFLDCVRWCQMVLDSLVLMLY
eukprot:TRINITY_DN4626_c0_g1_i4.p1 TRINITY_DN4626_c0_g1~~TRINITY_DN4626_c0_g1_i4.p1  ORF type:complete len:371 (+),score=69.19 TRINITY_DN4626_c0_g1_i4:121-1233(+)